MEDKIIGTGDDEDKKYSWSVKESTHAGVCSTNEQFLAKTWKAERGLQEILSE